MRDISYPPAPWHLHGVSVQALRSVDADVARKLVPSKLDLVRTLPGRTLGVLYCARYSAPSSLLYHELIVAPALVRLRGRFGFWISHIYVDNEVSVAGGRGIWGLPKQLAEFDWATNDNAVVIRRPQGEVCRIEWSTSGLLAPMPLFLPVISHDEGRFLHFSGIGHARVGLRRATLQIDRDSAVASLGFSEATKVLFARQLSLRIGGPRQAGPPRTDSR